MEGKVEQAARKQQLLDSMHEIKMEINRIEHEAIHARQVLDQRLKGFEMAGALTNADLTSKFAKW